MKRKQLPKTDSVQRLAEFWDTHDLTDFEDQLEEVGEPVFERQTVMRIPLGAQEVKVVKQIARSKGVTSTALLRRWVRDKIRRLG